MFSNSRRFFITVRFERARSLKRKLWLQQFCQVNGAIGNGVEAKHLEGDERSIECCDLAFRHARPEVSISFEKLPTIDIRLGTSERNIGEVVNQGS